MVEWKSLERFDWFVLRNCIGQNFAMNEMKTVLAKILRRYKIYLDEETPAPKIESRLILQNKDGIYVKLQAL